METQELAKKYKWEKDAKVRERLLIINWHKQGKTTRQIAGLIGCSQTNVMFWINRYRKAGVEGLKNLPKSGKPKMITDDEEKSIKQKLEGNPCGWQTKSVIELIKNESGIEYTRRHVNRLLNKWGFARIRPRKKHIAADEKEQKAFKKS